MIIPVLDLKNGKAVSGKSGARDTYKPLKTIFHDSPSPLKIAEALKHEGFTRMYIADLDSIEGTGSNLDIIKEISQHHISVMLDSGVGNVDDVRDALLAAHKVIVATETLQNMDDLSNIWDTFPGERLILSVDIKDGELFTRHLQVSLEDLISKIRELEIEEVILLDISRVGLEMGVDLDMIQKFRGMEKSLIMGGGIRKEDLKELQKRGLNKFLIGSALHSGKLELSN